MHWPPRSYLRVEAAHRLTSCEVLTRLLVTIGCMTPGFTLFLLTVTEVQALCPSELVTNCQERSLFPLLCFPALSAILFLLAGTFARRRWSICLDLALFQTRTLAELTTCRLACQKRFKPPGRGPKNL